MGLTVHYSIDQLQIKGDMLFGFGWLFAEQALITSFEMRVESADARGAISVQTIAVHDWRQRQDVVGLSMPD